MTADSWSWWVRVRLKWKGKQIAVEERGSNGIFCNALSRGELVVPRLMKQRCGCKGTFHCMRVSKSSRSGPFPFNTTTPLHRSTGQLKSQSSPLRFIWQPPVYSESEPENQFSRVKSNLHSHLFHCQDSVKVTDSRSAVHPRANTLHTFYLRNSFKRLENYRESSEMVLIHDTTTSPEISFLTISIIDFNLERCFLLSFNLCSKWDTWGWGKKYQLAMLCLQE